jgi:hypothetical protein
VVEAMHEIYAPPDGADHPFYEIVSAEWAARWPAEELWVAIRADPGDELRDTITADRDVKHEGQVSGTDQA